MDDKYKLLFVEDEEFLRDSVRNFILSNLPNVDIVTVSNGLQAMEYIKSHDPDAVLTDINMPGMSGIDLLHKVRELNIDTPFLVVTGFSSNMNIVRALRLGARDFLEKPIDFAILKRKIPRILELGRMIKGIYAEIELMLEGKDMTSEEKAKLRDACRIYLLKRREDWLFGDTPDS
jgi:YesN/AraC family two-component response regulator